MLAHFLVSTGFFASVFFLAVSSIGWDKIDMMLGGFFVYEAEWEPEGTIAQHNGTTTFISSSGSYLSMIFFELLLKTDMLMLQLSLVEFFTELSEIAGFDPRSAEFPTLVSMLFPASP